MTGVVGRFAPSPTGPLHFGSVVTAVASWLDARARGGRWLLRIDDLDPPREQPGAGETIIRTLEALALHWDGPVTWQSRRAAAHADALAALDRAGATFPCACTRREAGPGPYPGTCRGGLPAGRRARATRVRVDATPVRIVDRVQGPYEQRLDAVCGDFIVRRADGLVAYHLACVVDDAAAGVNDIVRGVDLLDSTPRQVHLQRLLGLPEPAYAHLPVVLGPGGEKLSKQTGAPGVRPADAPAALAAALGFLGLSPGADLRGAPPASLLAWALERWSPARLPGGASRVYAFAPSNISRSVS